MRKAIYRFLFVLLITATLGGCGWLPFSRDAGPSVDAPEPEPPEPEITAINEPPPSPRPSITVISKGLPEQYWQSVIEGVQNFADEYDVIVEYKAVSVNAGYDAQAETLDEALEAGVSALCVSGLEAGAISGQLELAREEKIPVVCFAEGVAGAPEGTIAAISRADGYVAGRLAADSMFTSYALLERIRNATASNPATIAVLSESADGWESDRTQGFLDKMEELVNTANPLGARITGHEKYARPSEGAAIELDVTVSHGASRDILQNTNNLIGCLCTSERVVESLLDATSGGMDLDKTNGIYKDLVVVGFDAGAKQKNAVRNQSFYGSVADDPVNMGYIAAELAYTVLQGETVPEEVDTGCRFYSFENMDHPSVAPLLYD